MMTRSNASPAAGLNRRLRLVGLLGGVALLAVGAVPSEAAITPSNVDPWQHIVDCAKALLSNPAEHAEFCAPGHAEAMTFHSSFMWAGSTPPPPPPPSSSSSELPPPPD